MGRKLESGEAAVTLDVQGQFCPYPIMLTRKEMGKLASGEVLKVISDSSSTAQEVIPHYCEKSGYRYRCQQLQENYWEILIEKS